VPPTSRDALIAVADLLAPGAPEVGARAAAAHDDPAGYVQENAEQLHERGIDEPIPELAWIALVDALADHELLAEVDWKEADDEIVARLRELSSSPAEGWSWYAGPDEDGLPTYDFLQLAGERLAAEGTALAVLDIDSDCYPLVLLPVGQAADLVDLASAAGFTAAPLGLSD
jgi:hypothetical protein